MLAPPILIEGVLDVAQVDHRRVHLDLAEIRVDGGVERELAADRGLEVGARLGHELAAAAERVAGRVLDELAARGRVGRDLDRPRRADARDADQIRET
ncbi:MAG: hypothetical protein E6K81_14635 [Candidatus Eisenbacteria bacterium]|uniref:Uncharacterized protein n=1 Tax=Eiseniibacteriota bacterium TaxID=2212470 RepID=A0A538U124_UNCEI|nr:MAG: hypothetical protein E6K81_14635 [Candidatus Eisenbacteria bacterium]